MSFWEFANPRRFIGVADRVVPWATAIAAVGLIGGVGWGFFFTPDDYRMGSTVKIFYIHVPSAMMAINAWAMMLVTSLVWLIRRHHVSALAAKAAAPVGLTLTVIATFTGALWGQPTWGSWWEPDPRLMSFLVLTLFYIGYIALWSAIEDPDTAADLTSVLCLVGSVFALGSRYAVFFFEGNLHQGPSMSLDAEENVADIFWYPALVASAGFIALFVALVFYRTATEIRLRRLHALRLRERMA